MTEISDLQQALEKLRSENRSLHDSVDKNQQIADTYYRLMDIEKSLNKILQLSLQQLPLNESLDLILDEILGIPWLALEKKGCVFLVDDNKPGHLVMSGQHNFDAPLLDMCGEIEFGQCLCGQAALTKQAIFKDSIDAEHTNRPDGMLPHGHHVMPIIAEHKVLGVLNLYVKHGHKVDQIEEEFLQSISVVLSCIILNKQHEQQLMHLSFEDALTQLPNRRAFYSQLERTINRAKRSGEIFAVFFLDLDKFKIVNDSHGHDTGDRLLKDVADRLKSNIRGIDILSRFGGDEFTIITELISGSEEIEHLRSRIKSELRRPFVIDGIEIEIDVSIGVSMYPEDGDTYDRLLNKADNEMYTAKGERYSEDQRQPG